MKYDGRVYACPNSEIYGSVYLLNQNINRYQRTNGPENAYLISGPTVSTKTSFAKFDIALKWVKVNSWSSLYIVPHAKFHDHRNISSVGEDF